MKDSKAFWDKQAKNFDSETNKELDNYIEMTSKHLNKDQVLLDFACGTGYSTDKLAEYVGEIIGVDYSEEMIKYAQMKDAKDKVTYVVGTIEEASIQETKYDVLIAYNVLHLLEDLDGFMVQASSLLKPNGLLISATACIGQKKSFMTLLVRLISKVGLLIKVDAHSFRSLEDKMNSHGFKTLESKEYNDPSPNLYLVSQKIEI